MAQRREAETEGKALQRPAADRLGPGVEIGARAGEKRQP